MTILEKNITLCGHGSATPSLKNMAAYLEQRYQSFASNGKRRGLVAVRRLSALVDGNRKLFHDLYQSILGRNIYDQNLREYCYKPYNRKYYSDCSSSGILTFAQMGYKFPWTLNTAGIYQSPLFVTVPAKIVNGHVANPEILKTGDALLFAGNDPSRPLQIGHVEWVYEIPGVTYDGTASASKESYPKWMQSDGKWYYRIGSNKNAHGWAEIDGRWYVFASDGHALSDTWFKQEKDGETEWYYLGKDCAMLSSQWIEYKGVWYYLDKNGLMAANAYIADDKGRGYCYVDGTGAWDGKYIANIGPGAKAMT